MTFRFRRAAVVRPRPLLIVAGPETGRSILVSQLSKSVPEGLPPPTVRDGDDGSEPALAAARIFIVRNPRDQFSALARRSDMVAHLQRCGERSRAVGFDRLPSQTDDFPETSLSGRPMAALEWENAYERHFLSWLLAIRSHARSADLVIDATLCPRSAYLRGLIEEKLVGFGWRASLDELRCRGYRHTFGIDAAGAALPLDPHAISRREAACLSLVLKAGPWSEGLSKTRAADFSPFASLLGWLDPAHRHFFLPFL